MSIPPLKQPSNKTIKGRYLYDTSKTSTPYGEINAKRLVSRYSNPPPMAFWLMHQSAYHHQSKS